MRGDFFNNQKEMITQKQFRNGIFCRRLLTERETVCLKIDKICTDIAIKNKKRIKRQIQFSKTTQTKRMQFFCYFAKWN